MRISSIPFGRAALAALLAVTAAGAAQAQQWVARPGMSAAQYQQNFDAYTAQGYRLTDVDAYSVNGKG